MATSSMKRVTISALVICVERGQHKHLLGQYIKVPSKNVIKKNDFKTILQIFYLNILVYYTNQINISIF